MKDKLKISAVIELNASEYTDEEYPYPNGSRYEFPREWRDYWKTSLKDSGLTEVEQIITGIPFVNIATIEDSELNTIVEVQLADTSLENLEEIIPFEGGIVVELNDLNIIPQCCVSLSDFQEWEEILKCEPNEWTQIWIGHPWIFARIKNNSIEFSDYCEQNNWDNGPKFSIDFESFKEAFGVMSKEIKDFKMRVVKALKKKEVVNSTRIADVLVNKSY
jgi:hypothetical protein